MVFFIDEARSRPLPPRLLTNVNKKMVFFIEGFPYVHTYFCYTSKYRYYYYIVLYTRRSHPHIIYSISIYIYNWLLTLNWLNTQLFCLGRTVIEIHITLHCHWNGRKFTFSISVSFRTVLKFVKNE